MISKEKNDILEGIATQLIKKKERQTKLKIIGRKRKFKLNFEIFKK